MNETDKKTVYDAIKKHGDSFWNDNNENESWNGYLLDDIIECLNKDGYDLKVVISHKNKEMREECMELLDKKNLKT